MDYQITSYTQSVTLPSIGVAEFVAQQAINVDRLRSFVVTTMGDYDYIVGLAKATKDQAKAIEEQRVSYTKPLNALLDQINEHYKQLSGPLTQIEEICKQSMQAFARAQAARKEAEYRLAQERAAKERAEAAKLIAEAKAKAEALEQQAIDQISASPEQSQLLMQEAMDQRELVAQATFDASQNFAIAPAPVKTKGVTMTEKWRGEIVNKTEFLKFAIENEEYLDVIEFSASKLNAIAKLQKSFCKVPGMRTWDEGSVRVRS